MLIEAPTHDYPCMPGSAGTLAPRARAFVAVGLFIGLPDVASAQTSDTVSYTVTIDCDHGAIRREGTQATYEIVGLSEGGEEYSFTPDSADMRRLTGRDCRRGVRPFTTAEPLPDSVHIRRFRIEFVEGGSHVNDALYLDSLQLTLGSPALADSLAWDVDGWDGWCVSGDPQDAVGSWREYLFEPRCYPCLEFSLLPAVEGEPIVDGAWRETAVPGYSECLRSAVDLGWGSRPVSSWGTPGGNSTGDVEEGS